MLHSFSYFISRDFSFVRYHGYDGYLDVTTPPYATPLRECFLKAGQELGYDLIDYNSDRSVGFSTVQATMRNGHRVSANKAFLRPIRNRENFHLSKLSTVTKIIVDPKTKRAKGVQFIRGRKTYFVSATKEIILCAGGHLNIVTKYKYVTNMRLIVFKNASIIMKIQISHYFKNIKIIKPCN